MSKTSKSSSWPYHDPFYGLGRAIVEDTINKTPAACQLHDHLVPASTQAAFPLGLKVTGS